MTAPQGTASQRTQGTTSQRAPSGVGDWLVAPELAPDAADPVTGECYADVIVFWVESEADKQSLVDDPDSPFFTTGHFNGHDSVLIRASDLEAVTYEELKEVVQDAWLSRASQARASAWLKAHH